MEILDFGPSAGRPLIEHRSHGVVFVPILRSVTASLACMRLEAGGVIAEHPATYNQLFLIVEGAGWVCSDAGPRVEVRTGQAAFWRAGERHESGTETGMVALVVEGEAIQPELPGVLSATDR